MKTLIAVRGHASRGKTVSIKKAYKLLRREHPFADVKECAGEIVGRGDIKVIMQLYGDVKVGIESRGDPSSRLFKSLETFDKAGCKVILCATRTKGETVKAVEKLSLASQYQIVWLYKSGTPNPEDWDADNLAFAQQKILAAVRSAIGA